jgi:eukaryotic-like serine/threonine-protein kinase
MVSGTQVGVYRVLHQIGEGGMGTVWLAEHAMLGRRAAIKMLHPSFTSRTDIVTRFFNEARAATAISDPGIVQIFDFGHHVDGTAYIAMEYLEGEPLDRRLRRLGRLALPDALRIMRQVASTLGVAHQRGIVHRDLKPENIFLVRDPEVIGGERAKILDFGIAKLTGDPNIKTNTSAVMGTPAYMSPEQCRGAGQVDQRSDVYAIGCVLFALVSGAPPFDAEGAGDIIAMHLREPPPLLSSRVHGIPPEIDALMQHYLAKDPAHRYPSGAELAAAIGRLLGTASAPSLPAAGSMPAMPLGPPVSGTTLSAATGAAIATPASARSSRGLMFAAIAVIVVGGGVTAIALTRGERGADKAAPAGLAAPATTPSAAPATTPPAATPPAATPAAPMSSAEAPSPPTAVPSPPAATPPAPTPPAAAPAPDPNAELASEMKTVLAGFAPWSRRHAGAPCPTASALGSALNDPWGHPIAITCTDQPANQIIGAISAGPDGAMGTADDIGSWQLGREVTQLVHGQRWVAAERPAAKPQPPKPRPPKPPAQQPKNDDDDIPRER